MTAGTLVSRSKMARLDTVIRDFDRQERIALALLESAGMKFTSMEAARNQQAILRRLEAEQREVLLRMEGFA